MDDKIAQDALADRWALHLAEEGVVGAVQSVDSVARVGKPHASPCDKLSIVLPYENTWNRVLAHALKGLVHDDFYQMLLSHGSERRFSTTRISWANSMSSVFELLSRYRTGMYVPQPLQ